MDPSFTSSFSACLSPQHFDFEPEISVTTATAAQQSHRPPRPHTVSHAAASATFLRGAHTTTNRASEVAKACAVHPIWKEIHQLGHDVKDGLHGLKEVWLQKSTNNSQCGEEFLRDLGELIEPQAIGNSTSNKPEIFTFDKIERLLNYCVPLNVDPRSPNTRVRDNDDEEPANVANMGTDKQVTHKSRKKVTVTNEGQAERDDRIDGVESDQQLTMKCSEDTSHSNLDFIGLMEQTNRLHEEMLNSRRGSNGPPSNSRSRHSRRIMEAGRDMNVSGTLESDSDVRESDRQQKNPQNQSNENNTVGERSNSVVVPGGLWSLPSDEPASAEMEDSYAATRSTDSSQFSRSISKESGEGRGRNDGNDLDDVLMMRSKSEVEEHRSMDVDHGSLRLTALAHHSLSQDSVESRGNQRNACIPREMGIYYTRVVESPLREVPCSSERRADCHYLNDIKGRTQRNIAQSSRVVPQDYGQAFRKEENVASPQSLTSNDKYSFREVQGDDREDLFEDEALFDDDDDSLTSRRCEQFSETRIVSNDRGKAFFTANDRRPGTMPSESSMEARDEESQRDSDIDNNNEAANRHFDSIISNFELSLNRLEDKESGKSVFEKLRRYQMQKEFVQRSRGRRSHGREDINTSPLDSHSDEDDNMFVKTSHLSQRSNAPNFLQKTTMGRKLNHTTVSTLSPRESVIDRAKRAISQVHETIESISNDDSLDEKNDAEEIIASKMIQEGTISENFVEDIRDESSNNGIEKRYLPSGTFQKNDFPAKFIHRSGQPGTASRKVSDSFVDNIRDASSTSTEKQHDNMHSGTCQKIVFSGKVIHQSGKPNIALNRKVSDNVIKDSCDESLTGMDKQYDMPSRKFQTNDFPGTSINPPSQPFASNSKVCEDDEPELAKQDSDHCIEESSIKHAKPDSLLCHSRTDHIDECPETSASGTDSFDSSVNWDALAYSMSENLSVNEHHRIGSRGVPKPEANSTTILLDNQEKATPSIASQDKAYDNVFENNSASLKTYSKNGSTCDAPPTEKMFVGWDDKPDESRIDQIKTRQDTIMAKIRDYDALDHQGEAITIPDDEHDSMHSASEEENRPSIPNQEEVRLNSDQNKIDRIALTDVQLGVVNHSPLSDVKKRIELMKQQRDRKTDGVSEKIDVDEQHIAECVGLWKLNSKKFEATKSEFEKTPRSMRWKHHNIEPSGQPSPQASSTEELMLRNFQLEQEMDQIRKLSPKAKDCWPAKRSPLPQSYDADDPQRNFFPLTPSSVESPRLSQYLEKNNSKHYGQVKSSYSKYKANAHTLKIDIPVSPAQSTPPSKSRLTKSPGTRNEDDDSIQEVNVRRRVSELMAEVKGFLAENNRARERVERDVAALNVTI